MITYSIIKKSQLEGAFRLDAEYYQPEYFINFTRGDWASMGDCLEKCQYGLSLAMNDGKKGYPIYKMDDINFGFLFEDDVRYVSVNPKEAENYFIEKNDIFFNRVNSDEFVGRTGIFKEGPKSVFASYLIRLTVKESCKVLPDYLNIFLNSAYGVKQIQKFKRRAVNQANVNAEELKRFKILVAPINFQKEIEKISNETWKNFELSKNFYKEAEGLILEELGLKNFENKESLFSIVNLSDVKKANRIDAEYFQSEYEKIITKIKHKKTVFLENFVKGYSTGFPFKSENYQEDGIPLIRINNIKKGFLDLSDTAYLSEKDYLLSPKDVARPGDIALSMSGTIGMSAVISADIQKSIINQRILRITPKDIDADYLTLLLNSIVGSYQLKRIGTGGVQTNISYKDIKDILIPELPKLTQQKIAELVKKSHEARKKAKELLEEAKQKVERLIEEVV
jgi:type I restriction enzyme S subunit